MGRYTLPPGPTPYPLVPTSSGGQQAVRILQECFLVAHGFCFAFLYVSHFTEFDRQYM